tara:strand:+ start:300 stop:1247 length:948 start_codon:yes stop_codon:yes gene_type:complete
MPFIGFGQTDLKPKSKGQLVNHSYFSLSYNESHEQSEWVYYLLTSYMINGNHQRTENFRTDNNIRTGSASKSDYYKSGYDRGHLAPAGDMKISSISMSESFLLSNISPQNPSFNRGGWKKLESQVRSWVLSEGEMYIVTGPILNNQIESIGSNSVTVPSCFYKIIYSKSNDKMIGLVMPNKKINNDLKYYVKSIDYIEDLTGIDFFHQLDDVKEDELESLINLKKWNFNIVSKPSNGSNQVTSKQCSGIAKSTYLRCKNNTKNENGYCYLHHSQSSDYVPPAKTNYRGRCTATTKKGTQCKRNASDSTKYCWQHQ